ncbi:MAG: hypothetical protein JXR94_21850 [Candidatus Hydrogenedentes bacterium]|nr:hypothetical protein [Candidatus Hydrogenedentota bacterium]
MTFRGKVLLALTGLAVLDVVVPVPMLALSLIYVAAARPAFFREWTGRVYGTGG